MSYRIAVDTGGTFTDVVVAAPGGALTVGKAPSTPARSADGVKAGLADAARTLGLTFEALIGATDVLIYGTTWATNAIVTGNTAKTALLVTEGFPDILVYRQGGKLHPFELHIDPLRPYMPRRFTAEIPERVTAEGEVEKALDEDAARAALTRLARQGVDAVAVCLLWSISNPAHEERLGALIEETMPGIPYTLSHRLNPILREYPRASSAAIDASLKPLMQRHLRALSDDLGAAGFCGELLVSTVSGGLMHVEDVADRPIFMVKSGPAMAPLAGIAYAEAEGLGRDVLVVDAGGTTFDVSMVRDGAVKYTHETWLGGLFSGHNLGLSSVDVRSVGAGGGSIAWIDPGGLLRVGPESAGADPGPAIIEEPTTTVVVYPAMRARVSPGANYILEPAEKAAQAPAEDGEDRLDPVQVAIMANRIDAILREMTGVVMRTARSAVIGQSRDFSCAIVTADNELLAAAEGIPAHIFGAHLQTRTMCRLHPDFREGDAYLHNDPYDGNSHAADWSIIVPVFCEGTHLFNVTVKGHQADCGDSIPTTYTPRARDVYEEGALIFPCVLVQRDFRDNEDIVRMCGRRISGTATICRSSARRESASGGSRPSPRSTRWARCGASSTPGSTMPSAAPATPSPHCRAARWSKAGSTTRCSPSCRRAWRSRSRSRSTRRRAASPWTCGTTRTASTPASTSPKPARPPAASRACSRTWRPIFRPMPGASAASR